MVTLRAGADIQSANVNQALNYVDGRNIGVLEQVGAISNAQAELMRRADGILDALPVDQKPQIDELVQLEDPRYVASLFPAEQALQPGLWQALEWPDAPAKLATPNLPNLKDQISDQSAVPANLDFSLQFPIAQLSQNLQTLARRIQLVANNDTQPTTISLADMQSVMADSGRFLQTEVNLFDDISREIRAAAHTNATMRAELRVPNPGNRNITLPHETFDAQGNAQTASTQVRLTQTTTIAETRTSSGSGVSGVNIQASRKWGGEVVVPQGSTAVFINLGNKSETVLAEGTQKLPPPGSYRVELWTRAQSLGPRSRLNPRFSAESEQSSSRSRDSRPC